MPLLNIVIFLIVVGVLLWAVNNYIPMDGKIKQILNIVVVIGVVLYLLDAFGILGRAREVRVGAATQTQSIASATARVRSVVDGIEVAVQCLSLSLR